MELCNIFQEISEDLPEEFFQEIANGRVFRLERIVSKGHITPEGQWYDQDMEEWVLLLKGEAVLKFEEKNSIYIR